MGKSGGNLGFLQEGRGKPHLTISTRPDVKFNFTMILNVLPQNSNPTDSQSLFSCKLDCDFTCHFHWSRTLPRACAQPIGSSTCHFRQNVKQTGRTCIGALHNPRYVMTYLQEGMRYLTCRQGSRCSFGRPMRLAVSLVHMTANHKGRHVFRCDSRRPEPAQAPSPPIKVCPKRHAQEKRNKATIY